MSGSQPKFYQLWSVWAATLLAVLTALEPFFPELHKLLPPAWQAPAAVLVIVLRAIKQGPPPPPTKVVSVLLCLLCVGCPTRPPERDPCYLTADTEAAASYLRECKGYKNTRDCPTGDDIERRHQEAQEACP